MEAAKDLPSRRAQVFPQSARFLSASFEALLEAFQLLISASLLLAAPGLIPVELLLAATILLAGTVLALERPQLVQLQ